MNRRTFLRQVATLAGVSTISCPAALSSLNPDAGTNSSGLPMRVLGRTREKVTILGLGSAPMGLSQPGVAPALAVYRAALEAGVNYVDTAHNYGEAETYLGELMAEYRERIFLATKALPLSDNPGDAAREMQQQFEESLRRLKTTHVDLLHVHSIGDKPPEHILADGGPLEFARKMKQKGLARFIGVTGHNRVPRFTKVVDTGEVDVLMVALNFADYHQYQFEETILPIARRHQCGILAMKVFGGHSKGLSGYPAAGPSKVPPELLEQAMRYSLGIEGIASAIIGPYQVQEVQKNVEWAKRYRALKNDELSALRAQGKKLAAEWGPRFGPVA